MALVCLGLDPLLEASTIKLLVGYVVSPECSTKYACTTLIDGVTPGSLLSVTTNSQARIWLFHKNCHFIFQMLVTLKLLVPLISCVIVHSARVVVDRQTDRRTEIHTQDKYSNPCSTCAPSILTHEIQVSFRKKVSGNLMVLAFFIN